MITADPASLFVNLGIKALSVAVPAVIIGTPAVAGGVAARVEIEKRQGKQDPDHALRSTANAPMSSIVPLAGGVGLMAAGIAGFRLVGTSKTKELARARQTMLAGDLAALGQAQIGQGTPKVGAVAARAAQAGHDALGTARALGRLAGHWGSAFALVGGAGVFVGAAGMGNVMSLPYDAARKAVGAATGIQIPDFQLTLPTLADVGQTVYDATSIKTTTKVDKQVELKAGVGADVLGTVPLPKGSKITAIREDGGVAGGTTVSEFLHSSTSLAEQVKAHNAHAKPSEMRIKG
ncbi:MAG: hypothetical protein H7287_07180 [Thermoleophilia bacterium]|nr:hypothetical protein [Thermoleophilia bacterium]